MRRVLGFMMVLTIYVGGVAACGSSDSDSADSGDDTETTEGGGEGGGESGGNPDITAYCDKVQEIVDKSEELLEDPTDSELQAEVTDLTTELGTMAADLAAQAATFDTDDAAQFAECQTDFGGVGS